MRLYHKPNDRKVFFYCNPITHRLKSGFCQVRQSIPLLQAIQLYNEVYCNTTNIYRVIHLTLHKQYLLKLTDILENFSKIKVALAMRLLCKIRAACNFLISNGRPCAILDFQVLHSIPCSVCVTFAIPFLSLLVLFICH